MGTDLERAIEGARLIREEGYAGAGLDLTTHYQQSIAGMLATMLLSARQRANARGLAFDLTAKSIEDMLKRQGHRCAMTNIKFDLKGGGEHRVRPWAPSIDRIEAKGGYVVGNIRLVATIVNLARNEFSDRDVIKMAKAIVKHSTRPPR